MRTLQKLPNGLAAECAGAYYLKQNGKVFKFISKRAFESWGLQARPIDPRWNIKHDAMLGFRAGSLLQSFFDAKVYLVSDNKLRPITDPDVWYALSFQWDELIQVSRKELEWHDIGEELAV